MFKLNGLAIDRFDELVNDVYVPHIVLYNSGKLTEEEMTRNLDNNFGSDYMLILTEEKFKAVFGHFNVSIG